MLEIDLPSPPVCVIAGAIVRVVLIVYGIWHDQAFPALRYTDIDYDVFTDAATHVSHGESPYESSTYRKRALPARIDHRCLDVLWVSGDRIVSRRIALLILALRTSKETFLFCF